LVISPVLVTIFLNTSSAHRILDYLLVPWLPGVVEYIATGYTVMPGSRPAFLGYWQRTIITVLVLGSAVVFFVHLYRARSRGQFTRNGSGAWPQIFGLLGPYTVVYFGALIIRGLNDPWFDRYLIPLQVVGIVLLLRYYEDSLVENRRRNPSAFNIWSLPPVSSLALLACAYFAVAGTHDWFAVFRARLQAIEEVRHSGAPRTAIQGGFEYDGWTQIENGGYINDYRIQIPPHAWRALPPAPVPVPACAVTWFGGDLTPIVTPEYFIVYSPLSCLDSAPFPPVPYHRWMPPFTGRIYVQKRKS
jgi:hypothetical protein